VRSTATLVAYEFGQRIARFYHVREITLTLIGIDEFGCEIGDLMLAADADDLSADCREAEEIVADRIGYIGRVPWHSFPCRESDLGST
jgi:hypothetical protein